MIQSIVISLSVYLFVCLSVCLSAPIPQKHTCMLPVAVAQSSSDRNAIRYVLPVLWMRN